jgi:hypothetical protein
MTDSEAKALTAFYKYIFEAETKAFFAKEGFP